MQLGGLPRPARPGAPERAVDEDALGATRRADVSDERFRSAADAPAPRPRDLEDDEGEEGGGDERDGDRDGHGNPRGGTGPGEREPAAGAERDDAEEPENARGGKVRLRHEKRGADNQERDTERSH